SIARGSAPYVGWLNSDDLMLPGMLRRLVDALDANPPWPAAYGRVSNVDERTGRRWPVWVEPYSTRRMALRCIISQPGTLVRRSAWEAVGGVDESLHMAMDYDLWWRLAEQFGPPGMIDEEVALNRVHEGTKTRRFRRRHYAEAMAVVRRHHGRVPLKWWLAQPFSVWYTSIIGDHARPPLLPPLPPGLLRRRRAVHPPAERRHACVWREQPCPGDGR